MTKTTISYWNTGKNWMDLMFTVSEDGNTRVDAFLRGYLVGFFDIRMQHSVGFCAELLVGDTWVKFKPEHKMFCVYDFLQKLDLHYPKESSY